VSGALIHLAIRGQGSWPQRYFTGRPCRYGHVAERYVSSRICVTCLAEIIRPEALNGYRKKYRDRNPEKEKARAKRFYWRHRAELLAKNSAWSAIHRKSPRGIRRRRQRSWEIEFQARGRLSGRPVRPKRPPAPLP
jgi:hypothetical protein